MTSSGAASTFNFARIGSLGRVLRCYRACFDETQRLRTVAHSPLLFRLYYGFLLFRGRCRVAVEERGREVLGFCMVRDLGDGKWLLSAIGVSPSHRGRGSARRLFEMVADRRLVLTVETGGPAGFYEKMGMRRTGEKTIIYVDRESAEALRSLPNFRAGRESGARMTPLNRSAYLVSSDALDESAVGAVRAKGRWFRWVVVEFPGIVEAPPGTFRTVVHEYIYEK